ncbi:MAG TPA: VCBS repeat-containing protein [Azospira sp.]|nr:VCBS repeat-containing protein [Azospira sp.]
MKIASADLQMAASHTSLQHREVSESLKLWVGDRRPDFEGRGQATPPAPPAVPAAPAATVSLSDSARVAQAQETQAPAASDEASLDPKLSLLKTVIEYLTGRKIDLVDMADLQADPAAVATPAPAGNDGAGGNRPPQRAGYGVEYDYHESYTEVEQTSFSAQGTVRTSDGKTISFDLNLEMSRLYHEESNISIRAGDAVKKDPLVLNFSGTAAQLTDQRFAFDIDADGKNDMINFAGGGSGFLFFDKNGDGKATDGSELFGTRSGDGFAELAAYDDNQNGWIDENDAIFDKLRLWTKNANGQDQFGTLAANGVGALALAHLGTPFEVKDTQNKLQASVLASGVFLQENGGVGSIQQLDLTV